MLTIKPAFSHLRELKEVLSISQCVPFAAFKPEYAARPDDFKQNELGPRKRCETRLISEYPSHHQFHRSMHLHLTITRKEFGRHDEHSTIVPEIRRLLMKRSPADFPCHFRYCERSD
jgi:hypothetical protein